MRVTTAGDAKRSDALRHLLQVLRLAALPLLLLAGALSGCGKDDHSAPPPGIVATACDSDAECTAGVCDPFRGCVDCLFDTDCAAGERCDERICRTIEPCDAASDCTNAGRRVCDASAHECVECLADRDCGSSSHCEQNHCRKITRCSAAGACPSPLTCDEVTRECVECTNDTECGSSLQRCFQHRCAVACAGDADCPGVYHCANGVCTLDVCEAGTSCSPSRRALRTCNVSGTGFNESACAPNQSCAASDDSASCVDWTCTPRLWGCSADRTQRELCSADGFSLVDREDCGEADKACVEGKCQSKTCEPGTPLCDAGKLYECNALGTERVLAKTCKANEYCDEPSATCLRRTCDPGAGECEGDVLHVCNAEGSGLEAEAVDCTAAAKACWEGACLPILCAESPFCDGDNSYSCEENGTRTALLENCAALEPLGGSCSAKSGRCQPLECEPTQPMCNGNLATVCADDGLAPLSDGVDCEALGQVCWAGECLDSVCTTAFACGDDGNVYRCTNDGTSLELEAECYAGQECSAKSGSCVAAPCTPNEPVCDGNTATVCAADGSGPEPGGRLCKGGLVCARGDCLPVICEPGTFTCREGNVHQCDDEGATYSLSEPCSNEEYCAETVDHCLPRICTPGAALCDGETLTHCAEDGSGPEKGGKDCTATDQLCQNGSCVALICHPRAKFCQNGSVRICNASGTASGPYEACSVDEYCDPVGECRPDVCNAGGPACKGEQLGTCTAEGSGFVTLGADCVASGKVCDLAAGCVTTSRDTLGGTEIATARSDARFYLNLIQSTTSRELTELELYLSVAPGISLTWLVYEGSALMSDYSLISRSESTSVGAPMPGFERSGGIAAKVVAGRFYAVGVLVNGAHTAYVGGAALPTFVGFGRVWGRYSLGGATAPATLSVTSYAADLGSHARISAINSK